MRAVKIQFIRYHGVQNNRGDHVGHFCTKTTQPGGLPSEGAFPRYTPIRFSQKGIASITLSGTSLFCRTYIRCLIVQTLNRSEFRNFPGDVINVYFSGNGEPVTFWNRMCSCTKIEQENIRWQINFKPNIKFWISSCISVASEKKLDDKLFIMENNK